MEHLVQFIAANKMYRKLQRKVFYHFFMMVIFNIVNTHNLVPLNRISICVSKHRGRVILEKFLSKKEKDSWVWCFTPYNPRIRGLRQEGCIEFEASLGCMV